MLREQARRTPPPQWVRVVGGWSEFQFAERRMPTLAEINAAAPDTPVFILHLYGRALLNQAALRALAIGRDTPDPPGGVERDAQGDPTGLLLAKPSALILYSTLASGPKLPLEDQVNSTRHFMRELNRLGITSVIDAGGGGQNFPDDYQVIQRLHGEGQLTLRIAYNLFAQKSGSELSDYERWVAMTKPGAGDEWPRMSGAGENLTWSAADTAWPFRASTSSIATAPRRRRRRRQSNACWKWACPSAPARMPRVASYNPWVALYWLTQGKTLGGLTLSPERNRLDRETALRLWTKGSTWFSGEEAAKGALAVGEYADVAVLSDDYFAVPGDAIKGITAVLTLVGGRVVHGAGDFAGLAPPLPPISPDWSPVKAYGGYQHAKAGPQRQPVHACTSHDHAACGLHGHAHQTAWLAPVPAADPNAFWGALGCSCFAF
jgi:predicted amidohydrolase YtcJ